MPMGDELASTSLNFTQKSLEISVELIKMLAPLVKGLWDKAFDSQHSQVGKVSQAQLFVEAGKAKSAILSNDNFLSKDADTIVEKAKKYGIPVCVVGDGEKVTLSYLERDKAVVNQILQETMRERMRTAPQDVKHFTVEECNLSAIKAELEKNGIECCFARSANGKIFCQYPAEAAGKVEIVKQDFKAAREKVAYEFKAYPENGKLIIEDAKQQKKIEFSDKLTHTNVQKICMEQFGYSKTEADLAAKKLFDDVSPVQNKLMMEKLTAEKYFANTAQLDAIRSMKVNIRYESDSIYLRDMTFTAANFADSEHTHISITNGDRAAALTPATMSREEMKGGKPVSKEVRGLAWIALRWAATVRPRVIILENVPEFVTWGRLGKDGRPDPQHIGETFWSFVYALQRYGYDIAWRELQACDFGAPTIRRRFFLVARCDDKPIVFPEATHGDGLIPYRTAAECIDWSIPCNSIFGREKPLAEKTLRRIALGLDKFTIKADKPFIIGGSSFSAPSLIQYHSEQGGSEVRGQALDKPVMTIDASPRYALTAAHIIKYYSGEHNYSAVSEPLHTITVKERNALIESHLCILRNNQDCKPLYEPMPTLCTSPGHIAEIRTKITQYNSAGKYGKWAEVRELLNKYCGYSLSDNEILLLEINGEQYFISDIGMRMLTPRELYRAQGFPEDYIIDFDVNGKEYPRSAQIARCGNAVPPPFAEALVRANLPEMCGKKYNLMSELREHLQQKAAE